MKPKIKLLAFCLCLCFDPNIAVAQKDSLPIWAEALLNSPSQQEGMAINSRIKNQLSAYNDQDLIPLSKYFLKIAARSNSPKYLFYDLFYIFQNEAKRRDLEEDFNLAILKLEADPDFSNADIKHQLYYFYSQFYYHLKEYYHATKYLNLFLKDGLTAFPENIQSSIELNSLTTLALIDRAKDSLDKSILQFRSILALSKEKKNPAWEGITSGNLAYTLFLANRLEEAIPYYTKDVELSMQNHEFGSAMSSYISLGELYLKLKKPDSAFKYIQSANQLLTSLLSNDKAVSDPYQEDELEIFSFFGNYYQQTGDFKKSSLYFARAFQVRDSLAKGNKLNELKQIVQRIEIDKNLNEVNELHNELQDKRQNLTIVTTVVIAVACILFLLLYFFFRLLSNNKKLAAQNETINEQRASLEQINADYIKLFSIISHDVRGPAITVNRLLQMMATKRLSFDDFEKILPGLLVNSSNLNRTIESLLNWSTTQHNGINTQPEKVEVKSFVDNILPLFTEQASAKSITLQNNCTAENVLIDKNHFEIIIRNTISNAIKFSHPHSVIQLQLKNAGNSVEFSLHDTGVGMTKDQIDAILSKKGMQSTFGTTGEKGIGLGLKLVKEFIERNAGTLRIESTVNVGTNLIFSIPKA